MPKLDKKIDLSYLRMIIADLQKMGLQSMSLKDLLLYIEPMAEYEEDDKKEESKSYANEVSKS